MTKAKQLIHEYFKLLDEKRAHKLRCPFPKQKELEQAEKALRDWAGVRSEVSTHVAAKGGE